MIPIVFDLDGTLIDSLPDIAAAVNKMLGDFDLNPLPDPKIRSFVGRGIPKLIKSVQGELNRDLPDATQIFIKHYKAAPSDLTRPYHGVMEALEALHTKGHPMGICTNKDHDLTVSVLDNLKMSQFFAKVIGGDSLPTRKPAPEPLNAAFEALGSTGIFIGDSEVDAQTAKAANVPMGLYTQGYRKTPVEELYHSFSFSDFTRLPSLIPDPR